MTDAATQGTQPATNGAGGATPAAAAATNGAEAANGAAPADGLLAFAQGGNTQAQAQQQAAPKGYWPDTAKDFEASYRGLDDKGTIDKLLADVSGRERAPLKAADYKIELDPKVAARYPKMGEDPVLGIWRDVAHANGLTDKQFNGTISQLYGQLVEKGLMDAPINTDAEIEKLMPKRGTTAERTSEAMKRIQGVHTALEGLVANQTLSAKEAKSVQALASTADGVMTLEKLFARLREHGLQGGGNGSSGVTKESLQQDMRDPRYDTRSSKFDPKFRQRVDNDWRRIYGV